MSNTQRIEDGNRPSRPPSEKTIDAADPTVARAALIEGSEDAKKRFFEQEKDKAFRAAQQKAKEEDADATRAKSEALRRAALEAELAERNETVLEKVGFELAAEHVTAGVRELIRGAYALAHENNRRLRAHNRAREILRELGIVDMSRAAPVDLRWGEHVVAREAKAVIGEAQSNAELVISGLSPEALRLRRQQTFIGFDLARHLREIAGL